MDRIHQSPFGGFGWIGDFGRRYNVFLAMEENQTNPRDFLGHYLWNGLPGLVGKNRCRFQLTAI